MFIKKTINKDYIIIYLFDVKCAIPCFVSFPFPSFSLQCAKIMETFVWWEVILRVRGLWRYATTPNGGIFVTMSGELMNIKLLADNWALVIQVIIE